MKTKIYFLGFLFLLFGSLFLACKKESSKPNPSSIFNYTTLTGFPATVTFVNTSTDQPGTTSTYAWDYGDGSSSNVIDGPHTYQQAGVYQVKLVQTPSTGTKDSVTILVQLSSTAGPSGISVKPGGTNAVAFTYSITTRAYEATFTNLSTGSDSFAWDFGDGDTSTSDSAVIKHTYDMGGSYQVKLVAGNSGIADTARATINF